MMMANRLGTLWGVGVGPGDPELITLKAVRLLKTAPVVAFPAGRGGKSGIAQAIVADFLRSHQVQLPLYFPYVHDQKVLTTAWDKAASQVWQYLVQGQDVVFATEGDASFYSTFTYLAQTLQQQHSAAPIRTVSGVCSPLAAAATLGIPLTMLTQRLMVLPALYSMSELEAVLDQADVVVLMKVASVYADAWKILHRRNLLEKSCVVVRATQPDEQIYRDLNQYPDLELPYFSLLIINCVAPTDEIRALGC
ncbi:precorrin-2 C(20)-methyltransferase [Oscillatoria sp. CS-180]|uniref:precorrin-2 C(20)-methyltransferase n=1 Tax=Oscillatoria sp. CS-180 TaxID=3021720 RepID=UPI00232F0454|nr:precorrin-2 C(20)-methyltransferase [Oscillatoria sp. CS-180]MDB9525815.1 precorrin-2 C(20)-methyltransferase [Oscillatoria sp. CS-180]